MDKKLGYFATLTRWSSYHSGTRRLETVNLLSHDPRKLADRCLAWMPECGQKDSAKLLGQWLEKKGPSSVGIGFSQDADSEGCGFTIAIVDEVVA